MKTTNLLCGLLTAGAIFASTACPVMAQEGVYTPPTTEGFASGMEEVLQNQQRAEEDYLKMQAQNPITQIAGLGEDTSSVSNFSILRSPFVIMAAIIAVIATIRLIFSRRDARRDYKLNERIVRLEEEKLRNGIPSGTPKVVSSKTTKMRTPYYGGSASAHIANSYPAGDTNCDGVVDSRDFNIPFGM